MSSDPTAGADGSVTTETGGQEVGKDDLGYDVPVTIEDAPVVEGRSEAERLLQIRTRGKKSV